MPTSEPKTVDPLWRYDEPEQSMEPQPESGPAMFQVLSPNEYLAMTFSESDNILGDRVMAFGQPGTMLGPGGVGKSRLLLQLACCTIAQRPWLGIETHHNDNIRWLIFQAENTDRRLQHDLSHFQAWFSDDDWARINDNLLIQTISTEDGGYIVFENPQVYSRAKATIERHKPTVVAADCLYKMSPGDLNKDMDMMATLATWSRLVKEGDPNRASMVLHHAHPGRSGAARATGFDRGTYGRNSKVLHNWTRGQINVAPANDDNSALVISCGKCSNGIEFPPFGVRLTAQHFYEVDPDFDLETWEAAMSGKSGADTLMTVDRVWELCVGPMTKAELSKAIIEDCGCHRTTAWRHIRKAEVRKKIKCNKDGNYFKAL